MRSKLPFILGPLIILLMIAAPLGYKRWRDREYRNLHVVEEGVLYRSGQLPLPRLIEVTAHHGIRTFVCLRTGNDPVDQLEEQWVKAKGLKFVRIPPPKYYADADGNIPADAAMKTFRDVMEDPANYPVLVHCFAGLHRTGAMCATFRMDFQGWTNDEAVAEMRALGYDQDHEDVFRYLAKYRSPHPFKLVPATPAGLKRNPLP